MVNDKFIYTKDEVTIKQPSCKNCAYAINNGVNGCKIDKQDLEIKFGLNSGKLFHILFYTH